MLGRKNEMIRFTPNPKKALEAIIWISNRHQKPTALVIAKLLFFADKLHLENYGRPIIGDTYIAMSNGPVPSLVYNIIKRDAYRLDDDTLTDTLSSLNVVEQPHPTVIPLREEDADFFSESDIECLEAVMEKYAMASTRLLYRDSHANRAWHDATENSTMDYELMINSNLENRDEIVEHLKETASYMVF